MLQEYFCGSFFIVVEDDARPNILIILADDLGIPILAASALPEDIKKYENTYKEGWDIIEKNVMRMKNETVRGFR